MNVDTRESLKSTLIVLALLVLAGALVVATAQQPRANSPANLSTQSSTGAAATLDQCRNGGVGATPVPCNPSTKNPEGWVNGNAQGQQSHWREGDSISYRVIITGLVPGSTGNTILFNWSTVHGSKHAIDYITSYDRTETTSSTPSQFFANNNNPCSDVLSAANCNPPSPTTAFPIPSPLAAGVLTNCGGSAGTFLAANLVPAGPLMQIKGYGAAGTQITAVAYQSIQVPSGTGQCSTGFLVTFSAGGSTVVLAWGGHIASQADWGIGNSASFISGSPYHMFLDSLNGASTGAQDRALATSAIFFTPSISTVVIDESTGLPIVSPASTGITVHDTAALSGASPTAGGTVTYRFWSGVNQCPSSSGFTTQTVSVTNGVIPNSASAGPLAAGFYSYNASYSGDISSGGNNFPANSACEPFQIGKSPTSVATTVVDESTGLPIVSPAALGTTVHDTAVVSGTVGGLTITGTVTYHYYLSGDCTGTPTDQTVTLSGGLVPNSASHGPLSAGAYSFKADYSGDSNYNPSTSPCEPFSIGKVTPVLATTIAPPGPYSLGAIVHDTAAFSGLVSGIPATGTVTYTFFTGDCTGAVVWTEDVTIGAGSSIPDSQSTAALAAGSYAFQASWPGDSNYNGATSACEPLSVSKASPALSTTIEPAGPYFLGAIVHDTSAFSNLVAGFDATGTVTYTFFTGDCSGTVVWTQGVTIGAGSAIPNSQDTAPLAAGSYAFQASWPGDSNYNGATSSCEPLTVAKFPPSAMTTTVFDAATNAAWTGTEVTGASAYDTATVTGVSSFTPTGTVSYAFFMSGDCSGSSAGAGTVTLAGDGSVPNSDTEGPLAAGSYSFQATYSGDSNYLGAVSACEPFTVGPAGSSTATVVFDAATNAPWSGTEHAGASAYDTATVSGELGGIVPTGTVTYTFFMNADCTGSGASAGVVTLAADGSVSQSATEGPLPAGSYSFQATYSGDSNYGGSTSPCEPFSVAKGPSSTATIVFDAATNAAWSGTEQTGASAYDTATVSASPFTPTGTVQYTFFVNGACSGAGSSAGLVSLDASGNVPNSATEGPLAAGDYSFQATYSGDSNYVGSVSPCEPFSVAKAPSSTATVVFDATTNAAWSGTEQTGASAYDTATVTASPFTPTGTVQYTFFMNNACSGSGASAGTVTLAGDGSVPNSNTFGPLAAGSYAFQATYSGDSNYEGSTSPCEPFSVAQAPSETATVVFDAATNAPWSGTEQVGASAYDTASVSGEQGGIVPTGTVTYTFFMSGDCTGTSAGAGVVTLAADGSVSQSNTFGPLAAGSYSFQATYSGDSNYGGSTSPCEPFSVAQAPSSTATTLHNAADTTVIALNSNIPTGSSVYDTATVSGELGGIVPTGTVTYTFFLNGACSGTGSSAGTFTLAADGSVSQSNTEGPLGAGSYSFQATYSGDSNYAGSTSGCEPFNIVIPSGVTDTNFCPIPTTGFRLIYIQDTPNTYTLTASNPGQFYSNVFANLASPGSLSVSVTIPYPFVTQGAVPIQVFFNQPLPTCGSTVPPSNVNSEFTISPTAITLASYGASPVVGVTTVTVTFTSTGSLPAGLYWFAIHLNYGLKGFDYSKGSQTCPVATAVTGPSVTIGCPQAYAFSNSITGGTPVTSVNNFNKDPGIAGIVTDSLGTPVAGAKVTVSGGGLFASATTDVNGYYSVSFKGSGKTVTFTITATYVYLGTTYTTSATVTTKLSGITVVNLSFGGLVLV